MKRAILLAIFAVLAIAFFIGREIGRYNSPDYGTEEAALRYLVTHMRISLSEDAVRLSLPAGAYTYAYDGSSNVVVRTPRPAHELAALPIKSRWRYSEDKRLAEFFGLGVTAPAAAGALAKLARATSALGSKYQYAVFAVGAVALASGGVVGYYTTYNDKADYDNDIFRRTLLNVDAWSETDKKLRACKLISKLAKVMHNPKLNELILDAGLARDPQDPGRVDELRDDCDRFQNWALAHL